MPVSEGIERGRAQGCRGRTPTADSRQMRWTPRGRGALGDAAGAAGEAQTRRSARASEVSGDGLSGEGQPGLDIPRWGGRGGWPEQAQ